MPFQFIFFLSFSVFMISSLGYASPNQSFSGFGATDKDCDTTASYHSFSGNHSDSDEEKKPISRANTYRSITINEPDKNELIELKKRVSALENSKLPWSHTATYLVTGFCMLIASSLEAFQVYPNVASFLFIFSGVIFTLRGMQMVYKNCTNGNYHSPDDSLV